MDKKKSESAGSTNRKDIALSFLSLASSGRVRDAYKKYIHPEFRHHNPWFEGDRETLMNAMQRNAEKFPAKSFESVRALEDNDLVAVHGKVRLSPEMPEIALVHIFRFEQDLIIEEWEVGQEVPSKSPNENGVF